MLGPPKRKKEDDSDVVHVADHPLPEATRFLPGLPAESSNFAGAHCVGASDSSDGACFATLVRGGRCKRARSVGNFCKQHAHEMRKAERQEQCWDSIADHVAEAATRFEEEQMNLACALSLQDNENARKQKERSLAALRPRLAELGLERVEVEPFGDCQFLAVLFSASVPLDCQEFRAQVCQYLKHCASQFETQISSRFKSFDQYLECMMRPQAWGDELTLCAMSHLLLRPIIVLSDEESEPEREFTPPSFISREIWGFPVYVVHMLHKHFDATCPIQDSPLKEKIAIKKEKPSS